MDNLTRMQRKKNMKAIKAKDTKPEMIVRKILHNNGYRYRLHKKDLPGKPDLYLKKFNTVVFIHGCFWHQHAGCKYAAVPKTNKKYWISKLQRNILRDEENKAELKNKGYRVVVIWECEVKKYKNNPEKIIKIILGDEV